MTMAFYEGQIVRITYYTSTKRADGTWRPAHVIAQARVRRGGKTCDVLDARIDTNGTPSKSKAFDPAWWARQEVDKRKRIGALETIDLMAITDPI